MEVRGGWAGLLVMVPVLLLIGGVVLDVFGPVPYAGLPLLSAGPLAACMVLTFRGAAITAAAACVLAVCVDVLVNRPLTAVVVNLLDVALISAIALWLKWVVPHQGQRFAAVRAVAEVAQRAVLPLPPAGGRCRWPPATRVRTRKRWSAETSTRCAVRRSGCGR
ncbi:hypothetical protein ACH4TQ_11580 [Streptomyces sp. NPDC021218]|uniref:hypothetical protein n=1 Tax=Streptomyces sp. NPDC021218 TaxID=3365119 RepID=UPI0037B2CB81